MDSTHTDLLSPIALVNDVVDRLLTLMLTPYSDVSHYSVGVTQEFVKTTVSHTGTSRRYQRLHHEDLQLNISREKIFSAGYTVFTFIDNAHYTTVIGNNIEKVTYYLDSINTKPTEKPWEIDMVIQLFRDEADLQNKPTDIHTWPVQYPTAGMHPQVAYLPKGVHPDLRIHIDCGLYAALMTVSVLSHQPLSVLLPAQVHRFRVMAAYILWGKKTDFNITTCVRQN